MEIYNADYYAHGCGPIPYIGPDHWTEFFGMIADKLIDCYRPKTVLDAGCAVGYLVAALRDRGVEAYGIDISEFAISQVREDIRPYCAVGSLTEPLPEQLPKHYDLVTNIEVLEHLYAEDAPAAVSNLCALTDTIVFSSSPDDFTEATHVNVQQREYWAKLFAKNGFYDCLASRPTYLTAHAVCFRRSDNWLRQIEDYERNIRQTEKNIQEERKTTAEYVEGKDNHIAKLNDYIQEQQAEHDRQVGALKNDVETKERYIQEQQVEHDRQVGALKNDIETKERYIEALSKEKNGQIESLNSCIQEQQIEHYSQIGEWKKAAETKERQIDTLKKQNSDMEFQISVLCNENEKLGYQYQLTLDRYFEMSNSTSWKITKPVRMVLDRIKGAMKSRPKTALLYKGIVCLVKSGPRKLIRKIKEYRRKSKETIDQQSVSAPARVSGPVKISILVPLYHTPEKYLRDMIDSVLNQTYSNWELCLCDASGDDLNVQNICAEYCAKEPRIIYQHLETNGGISENTNACARLATGEYLALLDHDDFLMPDALAENIRVINELHPDVLYSDEDHYTADHVHVNPFYKPNWSPDLLYSQMYIGHLTVFRRELFESVGGFRKEYDGSQDYDLMLRMCELTDNIYHIPLILYSWRESETSTAANADAKPYAHDAGRRALDAHLKAHYGEEAHADDGSYTFVYDARFPLPADTLVSIIIPMKDKWELTEACISTILDNSTYRNYEILILDNNSEEEATLSWLRTIGEKDERIRVLKADMEFNWSKINNYGARNACGDVYVFLNNDTLVISPDWLERLCENALRDDIGTVGALLKYEDGTIQHAGVLVGFGGWADHIFKGMDAVHNGAPFVSPMVSRDVTAVTGACVAIEKSTFDSLGGFDESFLICGSDVEMGIRANNAGLYNLYDANIQLYHLESKSRSSFIPDVDMKRSYECYTPYREGGDPFFNPNLDINSLRPKENCAANRYRENPLRPQDKFIRKSFPCAESTPDVLPNPYRIPEIEPMIPRPGMKRNKIRVNLLSPSVDKQHVFGGIATAIKFFEKMCENMDCERRIILMDAPYKKSSSVVDPRYSMVPCDLDSAVPDQLVPFADRRGRTIPVSQNDVFIATGWWTAYTVAEIMRWQKKVYGGSFHPLVYLIQDYEPGFYPWSSRYMLADSTYRMEIPVYAVFNSGLLKQHFDENQYTFEKEWCFEPVLNEKLAGFLPKDETIEKKRKLLIYGRPNTERNAFALIVMALRKWAEIYEKAGQWEIVAAGEQFESVAISETITLKSAGKLSMEGYAKELLESYVGISLMVSPHPSYPPLEMSTFGIKTITNQYAHKNLEFFNENIVSLSSCSPLTIAEKLVEICEGYTGVGYLASGTSYAIGNDVFAVIAKQIGQSVEEAMR